MASWKDDPKALSTFTPYIQQLPVDAMVSVGMEKQRRYDEGVQRIQATIDRVAGLDLAKDAHKAYLKSKMGELGNKLRFVAAGDFSESQLTNSVAGMVSNVAKDPIIQDAVYSTQQVRKGYADIETARKAGKSSVVNEAYWGNDLSMWLEDPDLTTKFNKSFRQYKDVDQKLRDLAKEVPEIGKSVDIPFKRDPQGNVIYYQRDSSGKVLSASINPSDGGTPEIDDAMLNITSKGKSAQRLLDTFSNYLDPDDVEQLRMNSWYNYRNANAETFKNDVEKVYTDSKKMVSDHIVELNLELKTNESLSSTDRAAIQAKINTLSDNLSKGTFEQKRDKMLAEINSTTNLDDYKFRLYLDKYLTGKANSMAYESYEYSIKNNPYAQRDMERKKLQYSYDSLGVQNRQFWARLNLDTLKYELDKIEVGLKYADQQGQQGVISVAGDVRLRTDVDLPTVMDVKNQVDQMVAQKKALTGRYMQTIAPDNLDDEQKGKYMDELFSRYMTEPSFIDRENNPELTRYVQARARLENDIASYNKLVGSAQEATKYFDTAINNVFKDEPGIVTSSGVQYSPDEMFQVMRAVNLFTTHTTSPTSLGAQITSRFSELDFMKNYDNTKYAELARIITKYKRGDKLTPEEKKLYKTSSDIYNTYSTELSEIKNKQLQAQQEYLSGKLYKLHEKIGSLDIKDKKVESLVDGVIGFKKKEFESGGVDVYRKKEFNPNVVDDLRKDPQTTYTLTKRFDEYGRPVATLSLSKGTTTQNIPISAEQFAEWFPVEARSHPIEDIKERIGMSGKRTTNGSDRSDEAGAVNAYIHGYNIPGLRGTAWENSVRLDVEGSSDNDGGKNDGYAIRMYVHDGQKWRKPQIISGSEFIHEDGVIRMINGLTPIAVQDFLSKTN